MLTFFFVTDDPNFKPPAGYKSRPLSQDQAVEELRGKHLRWCLPDKDAETYEHLRDITRRSQVNIGFGLDAYLEERKAEAWELTRGTGHTYLLLRADQNHELFTPTSLNAECPHCDKPVSFKLPYGPEKFVCPHCGKESSIGHSPDGLSLIAMVPVAVASKPRAGKRPSKKKPRARRG